MRRLWGAVFILVLAACNTPATEEPIPTLITLDTFPTAIFLTDNAPPPGFSVFNADPIDVHLSDRQGWTYTVTGSFEGVFDDTGDQAEGIFEAQVWSNELGEARRVVLDVEGSAISPDDLGRRLEGVRISNDFYMVDTNGQCTAGGEGAEIIADLSAGQLIGGVVNAVPTGHRQEIGGVPAWQYTFTLENIRLPAVHRNPSSTVDIQADLWVSPDYNAVLLFEVRADVKQVEILSGERSVTGTLYLRYELDVPQLDVLPNISVPHGC